MEKSISFAFVFVKQIESINLLSRSKTYLNTNRDNNSIDNEVQFHDITIQSPGESDTVLSIAKISRGFTTIAVPVEVDAETITILPIDKNVPKLFCDFPLIGTEIFSFPVVINNPNFNPTDPRDGIYLTTPQRPNADINENKLIIQEAVELYYELLDYASINEWQNLHFLAKINSIREVPSWLSDSYFNDYILKPIRRKLLYAKIVKNADEDLKSILNKKDEKYMWFPTALKKDIRDEIWIMGSKWFPHVLPQRCEIDLWYQLAWDQCGKLTLDQFANFVEQKGTIAELKKVLLDDNTIEWLNNFYKLIQLDEKEYHTIMSKRKIVPNQNGDFCKMAQLSQDKGDIDSEFKDILEGFENEIKSKLADEYIELDFEDDIIGLNEIVKEIVSQVEEKNNDRELAKHYRETFDLILSYFSKKPSRSKELFPSIFRKKHILYDDEKILSNIGKAEQFDDLLAKFNVKTSEELQNLLKKNTGNGSMFLPITEEILVSMGIKSPEEWAKALEDKDLQDLFSHDSVPTTEMFVFAQTLIAKAKKDVIKYLETLDQYDLSEMDDQTATTVLAGIRKNNQPISIVFRPAYNNEVIIYYGSERDTLDYEASELWVTDGIEVRQITLGHIIKVSQIQKFPI